jgi:2-haloacid dehalogenase
LTLTGIRACVFDAYGTLFDYASAAARCRDRLGEKHGPLTSLWREKQLQYTWLRSLQSRHEDFWNVTGDALWYAMSTFGLNDRELHQELMRLYLTLDAFPEVPEVLRQIKNAGLAAAILSNGSPGMLEAAVNHAGIGLLLDAVMSVEEVGVYKTHPSVYQLAVDRFACEPGAILFVSSNAWDAYAASAFGMRVVWCNRYGQQAELLPGKPDLEIRTLVELPSMIAG